MIRIKRTSKPEELTQAVQQELTNQFKANHKKTVWSKPYIKKALLEMSHQKCCYCECQIGLSGVDMHVDHFKPKSLYPNLVMEWSNLLPACPDCNRSKLDHDTLKEPIVNPTEENPQTYFYLKDYRYRCKDISAESKAKLTIGVLALNDSVGKVLPRFKVGNALQERINEIANIAIENEDVLKVNIVLRNKVRNGCRDILRFGSDTSEYSAFMSTIIHKDSDYPEIKRILKSIDCWDDELEQLESETMRNVFDVAVDM